MVSIQRPWLEHEPRPEISAELVDQLDIALVGRNLDGRIVSWNGAATRLFGWDQHEVVGMPFARLLGCRRDPDAEATAASSDGWTGHVAFETKDRSVFTARVQLAAWRVDGVLRGFVSAVHPEGEPAPSLIPATTLRERIEAIARHLDDAIITVDDDGRICAANDRAVELFGGRIRRGASFHDAVHPTDSCGERCALRTLGQHPDEMQELVLESPEGPMQLRCGAFPIAGSDGLSVVLMTAAPQRSSSRRRGSPTSPSPGDPIDAQLREALRTRSVILHGQPIVDVATGRVVQREILVRLPGADGPLLPNVFLPIAERTGTVVDLDRYVVAEALRHARYGLAVELNLSSVSLGTPGFADEVTALIAEGDVDPAQIVFEITESAILDDADAAIAFADRLSALGCRFALDDFGTGFNGLLQLQRFPVDFLKIDREFVRNMRTDDRNRPIVKGVIALASHLGVRTVAEGVEDAETLGLLRDDGVDLVQGYYLGRPEPLPT